MPTFRKKSPQITAHRWHKNGDHPEDGPADREGRIVRYFRHPDYDGQASHNLCGRTWHDHGWIEFLGEGWTVCPGDWITTDVQGRYCAVAPTVFEATYEPVALPITADQKTCCGRPGYCDFCGQCVQWMTRHGDDSQELHSDQVAPAKGRQ
ncbi:hypothetical protein [Streptomyces sp. NPDC047097]|uniref:hypothetical protein n=1 Tax=Streptomyces sp. NPDC047097 TaxID=3155260 RepID=UPI0033E61D3A